jgi:hypothetical protein
MSDIADPKIGQVAAAAMKYGLLQLSHTARLIGSRAHANRLGGDY